MEWHRRIVLLVSNTGNIDNKRQSASKWWWLVALIICINLKILPEDTELGKHSRPFIIARIPSLLILDGAAVSDIVQFMNSPSWNVSKISLKERTDSERFYVSTIMQQGPTSEEARRISHYHWHDLCNSLSISYCRTNYKLTHTCE